MNFMQGSLAIGATPRQHCAMPFDYFPKSSSFDYVPRSPSFDEGRGTTLVHGSAFSVGGTKSRRILCYGDSNSIGYKSAGSTLSPYGKELAEALGVMGFPCEVTSCGLSGYTSDELVKEMRAPYVQAKASHMPSGVGLTRLLQDGDFDLVIIMVGTNDLAKSTDPNLVQTFVAQLHTTCHALGIPTVNIVPPTVCEGVQYREIRRNMRESRKRLADCMNSWAAGCPRVLLSLDCETLVPKNISHLWEPDEIHLSTAGSQQLAKKLASQLGAIVGHLDRKVSPTTSPQPQSLVPGNVTMQNPTQIYKHPDVWHGCNMATRFMSPGMQSPRMMPVAVAIY